MPTNKTPHYNLSQWERDDRILMEDFNEDNVKIDAALKAVDARADGLARSLAEQAAAAAKLGNCVAHSPTFTGTDAASRTFSFPHRPLFCVIGTTDASNRIMSLLRGVSSGFLLRSNGSDLIYVTWSEKAITINSNSPTGVQYLNKSGQNYILLALLDAAK